MNSQAGTSFVLRRVAVRTAVGVWQHRGGVLLSVLASVLVGGYIALTSTGTMPMAFATSSSSIGANSDCADTAMAAIADKSPASAQRAYQCMDPAFRQRVTEPAFIQQMQTQKMPNVNKLARVGDYHTPTGDTMVYYAVDGAGQSVGYIVYLGQDGKVFRIE